jgi:hypothetical protein
VPRADIAWNFNTADRDATAGATSETRAVEALDDLHQPILVVALDRTLELAHPGALAVFGSPRDDGFLQPVQLDAAVTLAGPHVGQRTPELGMPQQRRRSSSAMTMPTWLTGLFVTVWIVRSASERPRKSQTSPVEAPGTASSRLSAESFTARNLRNRGACAGSGAGRQGPRAGPRPASRSSRGSAAATVSTSPTSCAIDCVSGCRRCPSLENEGKDA